MRIKHYIILLLCTVTINVYAQNSQTATLDIGDTAPSLYVQEWIKGNPIQRLEKGHIYIIEFWATWCKPCIAAMPHLSDLASKYKDKIKIVGISVYEEENTSAEQIREFVNKMGNRMDYHVAIDDSNQMVDKWINAANEKNNGIPRSFVVDAEGKLTWIGHPKDLDTVLQKIMDNDWNIREASENRKEQRLLDSLVKEAGYSLRKYQYDLYTLEPLHKPDSMLLAINEIVKKEPRLKNTYPIYYFTFLSLLKIDQRKALEYGNSILIANKKTSCFFIIDVINYYSDPDYLDTLDLIPEIYHLGAETYQKEINHITNPETVNIQRYYTHMAKWYWKANDKSKTIEAQEKAIETLKRKENFSMSDLTTLKTQLQQYKETTK